MHLSPDAEESFDKNATSFYKIKALNTMGMERIYFDVIKAIYEKP